MPKPKRAELPEPGQAEGRDVLSAVRDGYLTPDDICDSTGLGAAVVQHQILLLTLSGHVVEDAEGLLRYHSRDHESP